MCRPGALLPGLLLALLAGCATDQGTPAAALADRLRGFPSLPSDAVQLEVAVIERRLGDSYLNREVWTFTDEQVVDLEHKAALGDNGFRVGQVVGMTPSGLQSLLTSERACIKHRNYLLGEGKTKSLEIGATVPHCRFSVIQQGEPIEVSLEEAEFSLIVQPTLTGDGRTRLHFTPQVEYGEKLRDFRVAPDGSGYVMAINRPYKTFPALGWDVTLAPNQYVIVGGRLEHPHRLGHECFAQPDEPGAMQRLLVIRTNRAAGGADEEGGVDPQANREAGDRSVPLALQATWPAVRGNVP